MFAMLFACLTGCTKKIYVPVEHVKTVTTTKYDTIVNVQLVKEEVKIQAKDTAVTAETTYAVAKAEWSGVSETLYLDLKNKDVTIEVKTEYIETLITDSIPVPYPVEKIVKERYVTFWDKVFINAGKILLCVLIGLIITFLIRKRWNF